MDTPEGIIDDAHALDVVLATVVKSVGLFIGPATSSSDEFDVSLPTRNAIASGIHPLPYQSVWQTGQFQSVSAAA